jgi:predicted PurR-regulated permease PerM
MAESRFYTITSIFLVVILGYLVYLILKPFLITLTWAIVFAIVFYPMYAFLLRYVKVEMIAATISLIIIMLIILGPFSYLSFLLIHEVLDIVSRINKENIDSLMNTEVYSRVMGLVERIQSLAGDDAKGAEGLAASLRNIGQRVIVTLSTGLLNIVETLFDFVLMLFALFFFLKDGPKFLSALRNYLPFAEGDRVRLIRRVKDMIVSTVYGGVLVAIIQGSLGGIAFYLLGTTSPVLWGSAMTISSFLPWIGTLIVWGPMAVYLLLQGSYIKGIILIIYGGLVIGSVDNVVRPMIISGRTKMPTLPIFFSVLGGIKLFGLIGLIMGPLVMALFVSVFDIFRHVEGGENA